MATVVPFYNIRLRDLVQPKARLRAECIACGRKGSLSVLETAFTYGPEANLSDLAKRIPCNGCGKIGFVNVKVVWEGA